jgi:hypothetical protein
MYSTNFSDAEALAVFVIAQLPISPNCAGAEPSGPWIEVTIPVLFAQVCWVRLAA